MAQRAENKPCKRCIDYGIALKLAVDAHEAYKATAYGSNADRSRALLEGSELLMKANALRKVHCTCADSLPWYRS